MNAEKMDTFEVKIGKNTIRGDHFVGTSLNNCVYLHGAGKSSREYLALPRKQLQIRGIGSTSFDYIGHGESDGAVSDSSLALRSFQLDAVLESRRLLEPLTVLGASMGAYDAIKVTQRKLVNTLVLIIPAVYTPSAYEANFGPSFSRIIRKANSWNDSDAWKIISNYSGNLIVIAAENDAVIPREIPERLVGAAKKAQKCELWVLPGTNHSNLFSYMFIHDKPRLNKLFDDLAFVIK